ncbi:Tetratricopeptide repeat protein [anaerobic digester metagenome]
MRKLSKKPREQSLNTFYYISQTKTYLPIPPPMKKLITLLLLLYVTASFAQDETQKLIKQLVEAKKYDSVIKLLNEADPNNQNPELTLAKSDIFLKYFVSSIMHQLFALKDLNENESIMDYRGKEGNFSMYSFPVDSILLRLIDKNPTKYELHKMLGYFYHEVHLKYPDSWFISDSLIVSKFTQYYKTAYENGVFDYWSVYGIGYGYLMQGDNLAAIPYFEKSVELNDSAPATHYNLSYAYLFGENLDKAITQASIALEQYVAPELKADAARIIAIAYNEQKNYQKAYEFYLTSDSIQSGNYYTLKALLNLEVLLNKDSQLGRALEFFLLAPENPTIYQDLMEIYWQNNKPDELISFLKAQLDSNKSNNLITGNIYFYLGNCYFMKENQEEAKKNFLMAKELFSKDFPSNHPVFEAIDSYLNYTP